MKIGQRVKYSLSALLFVFAVTALSFGNVKFASAATLTWTGGGDGTTFSDTANWSTGVAPVDGDIINFVPLTTGSDYQNIYLENDLTGVEFAGLTVNKGSTGYATYYYFDTLSFQNNATITAGGSGSVNADISTANSAHEYGKGVVTGLGNLTVANTYLAAIFDVAGNLTNTSTNDQTIWATEGSSIDGNLITVGGQIVPNAVGGSITLSNANTGLRIKGSSATINNNITVNAYDGSKVLNNLAFGSCSADPNGGSGGGGAVPVTVACQTYGTATFDLTGTITLNSDLVIHVAQNSTVNITGTVNYNGHTITKQSTSGGTLNVAGSSVEIVEKTTTLSGDQPSSDVAVTNKETTILEGTRGYVDVQSGGILKGTGTANGVSVYAGGTIAPGNSPGKLTILSFYSQTGTYQAEIQNTTHYDQLAIGADYTNTSGSPVIIDPSATLDVVLYSGWSVKQGDAFRIIDNLSSRPISGTYSGLAEGAQFSVNGITFSITYTGGNGNDVVITALNTGRDPNAPNTGVARFVQANPAIVAGLGIVTAGILLTIALRRRVQK